MSPVVWTAAFLLLNLYVNGVPRFLQQDEALLWMCYWLGFFLLASLVAKFVLRLKGLQELGLWLHRGWWRNAAAGFIIGFSVYAAKYLALYGLEKFEVRGVMDTSYILNMLSLALLAMFFSSILNDVMIRGYWLAYFQKKNLMQGFLLTATLLYTLDDFWNEGLNLMNLAFSVVFGVTFAYAVLRTGSIWLGFGLHWGGNMMYRAMYGFDGQGILQLEETAEGMTYDYISLLVTALMFPVVYLAIRSGLVTRRQELKMEAPLREEPA